MPAKKWKFCVPAAWPKKSLTRLNLLNNPEFNPSLRESGPDGRWIFCSAQSAELDSGGLGRHRCAGPAAVKSVVAEPDEEELERRKMVRAVNIFLSKLEVSDSRDVGHHQHHLQPRRTRAWPHASPTPCRKCSSWTSSKPSWRPPSGSPNGCPNSWPNWSRRCVIRSRPSNSTAANTGSPKGASGDLHHPAASSINSQLIIARAERAEAEARLAQVQRLLDGRWAGHRNPSRGVVLAHDPATAQPGSRGDAAQLRSWPWNTGPSTRACCR